MFMWDFCLITLDFIGICNVKHCKTVSGAGNILRLYPASSLTETKTLFLSASLLVYSDCMDYYVHCSRIGPFRFSLPFLCSTTAFSIF